MEQFAFHSGNPRWNPRNRNSGDSISGSNRTAASYAAEYYINNELPAGQRDALLNGGGSYDDRVNALANLSANGMIQGAADYLQGE